MKHGLWGSGLKTLTITLLNSQLLLLVGWTETSDFSVMYNIFSFWRAWTDGSKSRLCHYNRSCPSSHFSVLPFIQLSLAQKLFVYLSSRKTRSLLGISEMRMRHTRGGWGAHIIEAVRHCHRQISPRYLYHHPKRMGLRLPGYVAILSALC